MRDAFDQKELDPKLRQQITSVEDIIETTTWWLTARYAYKQLRTVAEGLYSDDPGENHREMVDLIEKSFHMRPGSLKELVQGASRPTAPRSRPSGSRRRGGSGRRGSS